MMISGLASCQAAFAILCYKDVAKSGLSGRNSCTVVSCVDTWHVRDSACLVMELLRGSHCWLWHSDKVGL